MTSLKSFTPSIRIACSSIYRTESKPRYTLTIIPSQQGTEATAIMSALRGAGFLGRINDRLFTKRRLDAICEEVVNLLKTDPEMGVLHLAQSTHHFVINQDDYENDEIIGEEGREWIETEMAKAYAQTS